VVDVRGVVPLSTGWCNGLAARFWNGQILVLGHLLPRLMFHDAKETLPQHLCWNVTIKHQLGKRSAQEINLYITLSSILLKPITLDNAIYKVHDSVRFS